jgi:uncharacterized damage-inducible protein DinB
MNILPPYKYGSARTLVNLHSEYLLVFLPVWRKAKAVNLPLPETDHPGYVSLETLLIHVVNAARSYMVWMADKLELPDPQIDPVPTVEFVEVEADGYLTHLIEKWKTPLQNIDEDSFDQVYESNWGVKYSIDSMLEHAVVHPILHRIQLEELLEEFVMKK